MIVQVTDAVKNGEIVLPTIGYAVKAGIELTISDEDYYKNDIQIAIRKGFLVVSDAQGHGNSPFAKKIAVTNLTGRPLALDQISLLIGETSYISEKEYNSTNVQTAINAGMIEVAEPEEYQEDEEVEEVEEEPVSVKRKITAKDITALLDRAERETKVVSKPKNGPRKQISSLLVKPNQTVAKTSAKLTQKVASKIPVKTTNKHPLPKQPLSKKPQRKVVSTNEDEDQLTRLQRIASKIEVGGSVNRGARSRDEDPIDRLTRLAREIEEDQSENTHQLEDEDVDFIDRTEEEEEGEQEDTETMQQRIDEMRAQASGTRLSAWNPHTKKMMGRREASNKVAKLISPSPRPKRSVNEDGIMTGEVDFSDDGIRRAKKVVSAPTRKGAAKRPGLQPVGRRRGEPGSDDELDFIDAQDHDEIVFVDREQNRQRLQARPDILRRARANNVEID